MSLHKFAEQVASQGRGDDSLLVHMTPDEVRRLQAFAQANGRSLTINPETGLPEAGFLSDLFKAVAPIALGAFLGPAGAALGGGFMSAGMAGLTVGGITTLATGSLSRGLMAGLGAYGGAGLGESLMSAGTGAGMTEALAGSSTGNLGQAFGDVAATATDGSAGSAFNKFLTSNANPATMSASELASSGLKAAAADPMAFAKGNLGNLAYAAAPILAGAMVPTTTKLPDPKDTGYIRQFDYNINPDTGRPDPLYGMRAMTPVKASEFGNKTFQGQRDLFRQQNPNPYELGVGSLNQPPQQQQQPTPMAGGGIVALAGGGDVKHFAIGKLVSGGTPTGGVGLDMNNEIYKYFSDPATQALLASGNDKAVAQALQDRNYSLADVAKATGTQNQLADYERRFVNAVTVPGITADQFNAYTADVGLTGKNLATALQNSGQSQSAQYALTHQLNDAAGIVGAPQSAQDLYNTFGYKAGDLKGDVGGLAGLYTNINQVAGSLQDQINSGKISVADAQRLSQGEMTRLGISGGDIKSATGKDFADLFTPKTETKTTLNCGPGFRPNAAGTACELIPITNPPPDPFVNVTPTGFYGNNTGNPLTSTPGDITTNKDGTVTVTPNIPGRPDGGFTGMGQVKDAYTAGGGSLGYTAKVPKTAAEHNAMYNKLTDDSLDAYNFLMGKGKNLTQRKAATRDRPVMQRYDEAVLGRKIPKLTKTGTTTDKVTTVVGVPGQPQTYFDEKAYLAANPSVAEELRTGKSVSGQPVLFTSGYDHWLKYGKAQGWPFTGDYQGYTTALALANAAGSGGGSSDNSTSGSNSSTTGGVAPGATDGNVANSITGLAQGVNPSISVSDMGTVSAAAAAADAAADAAAAAAVGPVGDAPGAPGGGGDGGGDGDGGCVDPAVLITLADGSCVPAGSIKVGDVIFAMHEKTLAFGAYPVEYVEELDQPKALVLFDDGSSMLVSHSHKFFMVGGEWKQVYQLEAGDTVKAAPSTTDKTVIGLDPKGDGPVMKFTVTDAHTYISDGLISHNSKAKGGVVRQMAMGGYAMGGGLGSLGSYSDGGRLLRGPGDGVSDSIPATIGRKQQPARLADGEFVIPARIVSELGNGSTDAGAKKLYAMMDRVQRARGKTTGKNKVAANSRSDKYLPA